MTDEVVNLEVGRLALRTFLMSPRLGPRSTWIPGDHWEGGVCKAKCYCSDGLDELHEPPKLERSCGIYGSFSIDTLRWQYPTLTRDLVAVMAAEGRTIIGNFGLRTQYARIIAYWTPYPSRLCQEKFPDAEMYQNLDEMLRAFKLDERLPPDDYSYRSPCLTRPLTNQEKYE